MSNLVNVYPQYPFSIVKGEGVHVFDENGRKYIDFYGGHAVCGVGHCNPEVVAAISKQANDLVFYSNLADVPVRRQAGETLLNFCEAKFSKVFFCNTGAEANENALKIAIKNSGRHKLVSYRRSFHGRTLMAASVTDISAWHEYLSPWGGPVNFISPNKLDELETIDSATAAVILEPIQSIGGVVCFENEYLKALRTRCTEVGAMLIFDEIQTGMGRTGLPFVSGSSGITPDMMTLAKSLGNGMPVGAVVMSEEAAKPLKIGDLGATFGGNPLAMAAVIATINYIQKNNLVQHAASIGDYAKTRFADIPAVKDVLGRGCLLGLLLDRDSSSVREKLYEYGIIASTTSNKNILHLLPSLTIKTEHFDQLHSALKEIL